MIKLITENGTFFIDENNLDFPVSIRFTEVEGNKETIQRKAISVLNSLTDQYFYTEAKNRGDYKNMGEIYIDAQANDPDAQFLLKLYDEVWKKEEELEQELQKMGLEELLNLDLQKWAYQQYDQVKKELEEGAGA